MGDCDWEKLELEELELDLKLGTACWHLWRIASAPLKCERQLATKCWRRGVEYVASEAAKILVSSVSNCFNLDGRHSRSHSHSCCCTLVASQKVRPNPQLGHKIQY